MMKYFLLLSDAGVWKSPYEWVLISIFFFSLGFFINRHIETSDDRAKRFVCFLAACVSFAVAVYATL